MGFLQSIVIDGISYELHDVEFIKSTVDRDTLVITAPTKMRSNQLFEGMQVALLLDKDLNVVSPNENKYVKVKVVFKDQSESNEIPVYINTVEKLSGNNVNYYIVGSVLRLVYVVDSNVPKFMIPTQVVNTPGMVIDLDGIVSIN